MKYEILSQQDHIDIVQRMASKPFRKPYVIDVHFSDCRSLDQNALMWACLTDVSTQVVWHGEKLSPEDWKWIFTAALKRQRMIPGLDGSLVVLGSSTSRMSKAEMIDLIDSIFAFGAEHDVKFKEKRE